jgi:hypothetical protein
VKAVAVCGTIITSLTPEFTLSPEGATAKVNGNLQTSGTTAVNFGEPATYLLATADGAITAEWTVTVTLPDNCPTVQKFITYNQPVDAYYIEYFGGLTEANQNNKRTNCMGLWTNDAFAVAFENKKYSEVWWIGDLWAIRHFLANGTTISSIYGSTTWLKGDAEINYTTDPEAVQWREKTVAPQYPLDDFAAWVTKYKDGKKDFMRDRGAAGDDGYVFGYGLWANARYPQKYELPNNTDVTELYIRSEKVMDTVCDVYRDSEKTSEGTRTWTFWVAPATGFTLKYEATDYDGSMMYRYEVSKLIIGKPDWDGKHLHPLATDNITE